MTNPDEDAGQTASSDSGGASEPASGGYEAPSIEQSENNPDKSANPEATQAAEQTGYTPPPAYTPPPVYDTPSYPQQQGYPNFPPPDYSIYGPPAQKTNTMAIASLVASLVGFLCWLGSIAGIVLGIVAMNQIKQNREEGHGLAVAGIAIGAVSLVVGFIFMVVAFSS